MTQRGGTSHLSADMARHSIQTPCARTRNKRRSEKGGNGIKIQKNDGFCLFFFISLFFGYFYFLYLTFSFFFVDENKVEEGQKKEKGNEIKSRRKKKVKGNNP